MQVIYCKSKVKQHLSLRIANQGDLDHAITEYHIDIDKNANCYLILSALKGIIEFTLVLPFVYHKSKVKQHLALYIVD